MCIRDRFLVEAAEWVGTQKWTSAMNDMFSSFEQLYAETLKCLKEREDEQEAVLALKAAREKEVTAAIDKILKIRSGDAAPGAGASGSASGAASAAAVGAASSPVPEPDSDEEAWDAEAAQAVGEPTPETSEERSNATYVPDPFVTKGAWTDDEFPRTLNDGIHVKSKEAMERYVELQNKSIEDLNTLFRVFDSVGVKLSGHDADLLVPLITVRQGFVPQSMGALPKRVAKPRPPPGRPPVPPIPGAPPPPKEPPPPVHYDSTKKEALKDQAWKWLHDVYDAWAQDPDAKMILWGLPEEQLQNPTSPEELFVMMNPWYAERRDRSWKMCAVCCNTLDDWHVKSEKHKKRVAEIMDPTWRLSTDGRSMWMSRRQNTYCAMLVERLGWDFCTKKCKLLDLPPPVISTSPQPPKKTRETYGKAAEWLAPAETSGKPTPGALYVPEQIATLESIQAARLQPDAPSVDAAAAPDQSIVPPPKRLTVAGGAAPAAAARDPAGGRPASAGAEPGAVSLT